MSRRVPCLALTLMLAACSSDGVDEPNESEGGAGKPGGSAGETSTPRCDPGPGYGEPVEPQLVERVTAKLVDQDDEPLGGEIVQVCGTDICINGESAPNGGVAIDANQPIRKPALKFGEGKVSAKFAWLLPDEPELELGVVRTVRLPELGTGEPLVAGATATSDTLTLSLAEGTNVRFDALTFRTADERKLRAAPIPLDRAPAAIAPSYGFELLYAATPAETSFCPPAALSVENTPGWEPGTAVEVWLHGVDITEEWAPYGGFAKVSDARVSDDGERIETTEPGLPVLGVLGFKRP